MNLYKVAEVREFQVVQETLKDLVIHMVTEGAYSFGTEGFLREVIMVHGDSTFNRQFKYREVLPTTPSDKRRFIISEVPLSCAPGGNSSLQGASNSRDL